MSPLEVFGLFIRGIIGGSLALWVYNDVRRRERSMLWTLGTFFIPEAFFPLYFWNQIPELSWVCPKCRRRNRPYSRQCRQCEKIYTAEETIARLHGYLETSDAVVILLITLLIQDLGYSIAILLQNGVDRITERAEIFSLPPSHFWFVKLITGNVLLWLCVYCISVRYHRTMASVGFKYSGKLVHLAPLLLLAPPLFLAAAGLQSGVEWFSKITRADWLSELVAWEQRQRSIGMPENLDAASALLFGFALLILLPVGEEILFRGVALTAFADRFGRRKAVILSALLFTLTHGFFRYFTPPVLEGIPLFIMGVILARLYIRLRSLIPGMLIHSGVNLIWLVIWFH
jgi:membrane protease YdiL (CAAX protease family)